MKTLLTFEDHGFEPLYYHTPIAPSVAIIQSQLRVDSEIAREVRRLLKGQRDVFAYRSAVERQREAYNPHDALTLVFEALNEVLEGHGVEYIRSREDTIYEVFGLEYVNQGDPYAPTLVYDHRSDHWYCCSWGDIVETSGRRFE